MSAFDIDHCSPLSMLRLHINSEMCPTCPFDVREAHLAHLQSSNWIHWLVSKRLKWNSCPTELDSRLDGISRALSCKVRLQSFSAARTLGLSTCLARRLELVCVSFEEPSGRLEALGALRGLGCVGLQRPA